MDNAHHFQEEQKKQKLHLDCYINNLDPYGISKFKSYKFLSTTYLNFVLVLHWPKLLI